MKAKDIYIVGSSGFAHEVKFVIDRINSIDKVWNFCGYIDRVGGEDVVGNDEFLISCCESVNIVVAIGNPDLRRKVISNYIRNNNIKFPNIVDPSVIIGSNCNMGIGNIICASSIITTGVKIGNFNIINLSCTVGHGSVIQDYITINPGSNISGDVELMSGVEVGTGVKIIQGIRINDNTILGAGAVVIDEIESGSVAVGVPARVIRTREYNI